MTTSSGPDSLLSATPAEVEQGIAREFRKRPPVTADHLIAQIAMVVVRPVLEAKDAEITRQRATVTEAMTAAAGELFGDVARAAADEVVTARTDALEAAVRKHCARILLSRAASLRTAAEGLLETGQAKMAEQRMAEARIWREAAELIDPPGEGVPAGETREAVL
jgi:hypothetical protein